MKTLVTAVAATLAAPAAFASNLGGTLAPPIGATPVPEISALEGTAALAALAAVVLFAWERRRRAA